MKTLLVLALLAFSADALAAELPGDSTYQLSYELTDHDGARVKLASFRGEPVLLTMFYGTCKSACPMLIADLKRVEKAIPAELRGKVRVLLVSFDPDRDTPASLKALGAAHQVDLSRWRFLVATPDAVRDLAAVLGIKYRFTPDGEINHSSVITLLDREGRIVHQLDGLRQSEAPLVAKLHDLRPAARLPEREEPASCH